ncbi:MAG TPA: hypothetical protein VEH04_10520 [Verrucomicrobiae bacterium]|nr:hypothetical protein [Verrucomicrobiae bacterium]
MKLGVGRAFDINSNPRNQGMRVRKHWLQLEGRDWLFEEMPFDDVRERLARLPTQAGTGPRKPQLRAAALERILPTRRLAGTPANRVMSVAKLEGSRPGFVVDYHAVNSITNFTFKGDTTYYVSGSVMFSGSVVIEGGTVVKFNPISGWGGLFVDNTSIDCQTSEYRPAVFTSMHDNTVGESISGSSGLPSSAPDQNSYLQTTDADQNLQHLRMLYSYTGLTVMYGNGRVSDSQFSHNQYPIYTVNSPKTKFLNVLLNDASQVAVWIYNGKVEIQNGTIHRCNQLFENESGGALAITNTLLAGVTNWGDAYVGSFNATNSGSLVFQTAGAAGHYLPTNSIYRNAGTTNIDATLLGILRTKTTEAPIVYSNISIPTSTVFSPRVSRDEAAPDLGFHYDPIDYAFGGVTAVSNLTFAPGAALAWFELNGSGGAGSGIALGPYGSINLTGTVTSPAVLARYSTVQEGGNGNWTEKGWLAGVTTVANNPSPVDANLRFAKVFALANDPNHFRDYFGTLNVRATHSEFWNASIAGYGAFQYYTNCLLNRVYVGLHCECAFGIVMRNCTMRGGSLVADRWSGAPATQGLSVSDTAFDGTSIVNNSGGLTNTMAAYNAFLTGSNTIVPTSGNNVAVATTYDWQKNWLGNSYLPPASPLINSGSVSNAGLAGLYHFTTQTNQAKDAATRLDIGYHYVAESVQGLRYVPTDTDGDGSADYLEDGNGNGIADMSETSWLLNNYNGLNSVLALEVFTPLK